MRRTLLALLLAMSPAAVSAQPTPVTERQSLPRDVRREIVERWNTAGPTTLRSSGRVEIDEGRRVRGDVMVSRGPLLIAGHVTGNVLAINSDVTLLSSSQIDGDVLVVGGDVVGRNFGRVGGSIRIYRQALLFRDDGDRIVADDDDESPDENWWRRFERRREIDRRDELRIVQAGPYNRVEGLPIELGPVFQRRTPWGTARFEGAAVLRTGTTFSADGGDVGHNIRGEVRVGRRRGIGVGASVFNVVDAVERWQLSDLETALAAFVVRRDYRDYYNRHGRSASLTLYGAQDLSLTASYGEERWASRAVRNPFTIFDGTKTWRPNPAFDEGLFHIASTRLSFDTRSDPDDPWSGWYLNADIEFGRGALAQTAPTSTPRATDVDGVTAYTRGMFDFRRYNRLGPVGQLNMRLVLGGWLDGDPLPLQRRVSVDGPGALSGFDFRSLRAGPDVSTCSSGAGVVGHPTECDRIALAQIEYRGDLRLNVMGNWEDWPSHLRTAHGDAVWVVFADAGRGWKVGTPDGVMTYDRVVLPSLSTLRSDVGIGLDVGGIGVYASKSVSTPSQPVNFFLRLRHRL